MARQVTPNMDELEQFAGYVGSAVGQVRCGAMPPDFIQDVVNGSPKDFRQLFRGACQEVGHKKALKRVKSSAKFSAKISARPGGGGAEVQAETEASALMERLVL